MITSGISSTHKPCGGATAKRIAVCLVMNDKCYRVADRKARAQIITIPLCLNSTDISWQQNKYFINHRAEMSRIQLHTTEPNTFYNITLNYVRLEATVRVERENKVGLK